MINVARDCAHSLYIVGYDEILRIIAIACVVMVGFLYGYYFAIRGTEQDVKDLKEAAKALLVNK